MHNLTDFQEVGYFLIAVISIPLLMFLIKEVIKYFITKSKEKVAELKEDYIAHQQIIDKIVESNDEMGSFSSKLEKMFVLLNSKLEYSEKDIARHQQLLEIHAKRLDDNRVNLKKLEDRMNAANRGISDRILKLEIKDKN